MDNTMKKMQYSSKPINSHIPLKLLIPEKSTFKVQIQWNQASSDGQWVRPGGMHHSFI